MKPKRKFLSFSLIPLGICFVLYIVLLIVANKRPIIIGAGNSAPSPVFNGDGRYMFSSEEQLRLSKAEKWEQKQVFVIWDIKNRRPIRRFLVGDSYDGSDALTVSKSGQYFVYKDYYDSVSKPHSGARLVDLRRLLAAPKFDSSTYTRLPPHIGGCSFSPDGKFLAMTYHSSHVQKGTPHKPNEKISNVPDSPTIPYVSTDTAQSSNDYRNAIALVDLVTLKTVRKAFIPPASGIRLTFSPDGQQLACLINEESADSLIPVIQIYDTSTLTYRTLKTSGKGAWSRVTFTEDGHLSLADYNDYAQVWDVKTPKLLMNLKSCGYITALSPNGEMLAGCDGTYRNIRLWNLRTGKLIRLIKHKLGNPDSYHPVGLMSFSPDSSRLAVQVSNFPTYLYRVP